MMVRMMIGRNAAVFSLLLFWTAGTSGGGEFLLEHWTTETGLPQMNVQCYAPTRDGFLWAGTWDGLARFDGLSWKTYRTAGYPLLPHNNCIALAEATDGTLWIGTRACLVGLRGSEWRTCANAKLRS